MQFDYLVLGELLIIVLLRIRMQYLIMRLMYSSMLQKVPAVTGWCQDTFTQYNITV